MKCPYCNLPLHRDWNDDLPYLYCESGEHSVYGVGAVLDFILDQLERRS